MIQQQEIDMASFRIYPDLDTGREFVSLGELYRIGWSEGGFHKWEQDITADLAPENHPTFVLNDGRRIHNLELGVALDFLRDSGWLMEPPVINGNHVNCRAVGRERVRATARSKGTWEVQQPASIEASSQAKDAPVPAVVNPHADRPMPAISDREVGGEQSQAVDAWQLWRFLESNVDFDDWLEDRLIPFVGGRDYEGLFITLDTAKRISMMERTRKGDDVRDYFIRCEKKMRRMESAPSTMLDINDPVQLLAYLTDSTKKLIESNGTIKQLETKIEGDRPAVRFVQEFVESDKLYGLQEASRIFGLTPNQLPKMLRDKGVLQKKHNGKNVPYAKYLKYFEIKLADPDNSKSHQTFINSVGMEWIGRSLNIKRDAASSAQTVLV